MQNFIRWVLILSIMILLADRLFVEMIKLIWRHYGRSWPLWWGFYGNSKSEQTRRLGSVKGPVVYTSKRKPAPVSHPRKPALLTCPFWLLSFKCWHSEGTWTELCGFCSAALKNEYSERGNCTPRTGASESWYVRMLGSLHVLQYSDTVDGNSKVPQVQLFA